MTSISYRLLWLLDTGWHYRYFILLPMIIFPLLGLVIGVISPKEYRIHTSLLIQETSEMNPFLQDLAVSSKLKERFNGLNTLLHSRHILEKVAIERELLPTDATPQEIDEIIENISSNLSMTMPGQDSIRIDYRANKPAGMQELLTAVSLNVIDELLAPERSSMKDSSYFLAEHVKFQRNELNQAEAELAQYRTSHPEGLPNVQLANYTRLETLKQTLAEKEAAMAGAQKSLGSLDQQLSRTNPIIGQLEQKLVRLQSELALLQARYTDNHSAVKEIKRDIEHIENQRSQLLDSPHSAIDTNKLWDIANSHTSTNASTQQPLLISQLEQLQLARAKVDTLEEETRSLRNMIAELELTIQQSAEQEREIQRLERDLQVKRELFNQLLARSEKARLTSSLGIFEQEKRIKIIDKPFTPAAPSSLPLWAFVVSGFICGVLFGHGISLLLELTDTRIRHISTLEQITQVPVITRLPKFDP